MDGSDRRSTPAEPSLPVRGRRAQSDASGPDGPGSGAPCLDAADSLPVLGEQPVNAVQHTRSGGPHGSFLVRLGRRSTGLHLEVTDAGGPTTPAVPAVGAAGAPEAWTEGGRGLQLVGTLATNWDIHGDHRSRTITAEIAISP